MRPVGDPCPRRDEARTDNPGDRLRRGRQTQFTSSMAGATRPTSSSDSTGAVLVVRRYDRTSASRGAIQIEIRLSAVELCALRFRGPTVWPGSNGPTRHTNACRYVRQGMAGGRYHCRHSRQRRSMTNKQARQPVVCCSTVSALSVAAGPRLLNADLAGRSSTAGRGGLRDHLGAAI